MQCPNCHHWNEAGSRFCEECGTELVAVEVEARQVSVRPASAADVPVSIPDAPQQVLTPVSSPVPAPYQGPHLVLETTGSIFKLGDATVIGREDPVLQIDLEGYPEGQYISHRHAQIIKMNDKFYIEDLGSSNFTWVNEIKLAQGQAEPLENGDKVRLGKITLTFHDQ
jgi:hypothetical protein